MLGVRESSTRISEEVRLQPARATAHADRYQDRSRQPRLTTLRTGSIRDATPSRSKNIFRRGFMVLSRHRRNLKHRSAVEDSKPDFSPALHCL